jgi:hypothetical protein
MIFAFRNGSRAVRRRQRALLAFALLVMVGLIALGSVRWATRPAQGSIHDRAERLQAGMTADEIAEIMGEYGRFHEFGNGETQIIWQEKRYALYVIFNPQTTGASAALLTERLPDDTEKITALFGGRGGLWDKIGRWLRL